MHSFLAVSSIIRVVDGSRRSLKLYDFPKLFVTSFNVGLTRKEERDAKQPFHLYWTQKLNGQISILFVQRVCNAVLWDKTDENVFMASTYMLVSCRSPSGEYNRRIYVCFNFQLFLSCYIHLRLQFDVGWAENWVCFISLLLVCKCPDLHVWIGLGFEN